MFTVVSEIYFCRAARVHKNPIHLLYVQTLDATHILSSTCNIQSIYVGHCKKLKMNPLLNMG